MERRWIEGHLDRSQDFPRVDWDAVAPRIEEVVPETARNDAWTAAAREWLTATRDALGGAYGVHESEHFLLLVSFPEKTTENLAAFLERTLARIMGELLPGIADDGGSGKAVAIVLADIEAYYSYIAHFYPPEGQFAASGGVRVSHAFAGAGWGYGHFVAHGTDVLFVERTIAHELTHDLVAHLPIPAWLDEGLASTVEDAVMRDSRLTVSAEELDDHRAVWGGGGIQEFWSGAAVHRPDDASRLTYQLARMAVKALSHDYARFREFVLRAHHDDAGEAAAAAVYGRGLAGLVTQFLGPGDWTPAPATWDAADEDRSRS